MINDPAYVMGFIAGFAFCAVVVSLAYLVVGVYATKVARKVAEYAGPTGAEAQEVDAGQDRERESAEEARSGDAVQRRSGGTVYDDISDDNDARVAARREQRQGNSAAWPV